MAHSVNILLLTLGVLQGALLGGYFLRKRKFSLANGYFVLILMVAGLQLTFKLLSKAWLMEHHHLPYILSYHFPYVMGPILYLYIQARAGAKFKGWDLLSFVPFALMCGIVTLQFFNRGQYWYLGLAPYSHASLQIFSLFIYGYLSLKLIYKHELTALKSFVVGLVCCEVVISVTLAVMYMYYYRFPDVRLLFIALTLFIYWVTYKMLESPDLFVVGEESATISLKYQSATKYNHSGLKSEDSQHIASQLTSAMNQQKLFLDSGLTIDTLSMQLGVSKHHLSQVLNERFRQTYPDFINDYRLTEAKSRLQETKYHHYTISAIALDCGFSSVSNFNDLFKKKFGQTPSQCRMEGRGKMTA